MEALDLISTSPEIRRQLIKALEQMETALLLLDEVGVPSQVGAMLDLAISRLEAALKINTPAEDAKTLLVRLEQELATTAKTEDPSPWQTGPM